MELIKGARLVAPQRSLVVPTAAPKSLSSGDDFPFHIPSPPYTGAIYEWHKKHLGVSDTAIIALRKFLLKAVRNFETAKNHLIGDSLAG